MSSVLDKAYEERSLIAKVIKHWKDNIRNVDEYTVEEQLTFSIIYCLDHAFTPDLLKHNEDVKQLIEALKICASPYSSVHKENIANEALKSWEDDK